MLADSPRTMAYQKAIEGNADFFKGKTVMGEPIDFLAFSYLKGKVFFSTVFKNVNNRGWFEI